MSEHGLAAAVAKMRAAGANEPAIDVFAHYYAEAAAGVTGMIPESTISPLTDPPQLSDAAVDPDAARAAIARTVIIKLNGGLGTSMGLDQAKTLLPVREGLTFLDLIVQQIKAARAQYDAPLPLLFMNSFRTRADTLAHLERYPDLAVDGLPIDFVQNAEPKITADTFEPVEWPADPTLEWCPPGHGDVYTALVGSGVLDALLAAGMKYASISNGDNLGAAPDAELAGWFAGTGAPYAAEICPRTINDRKGGHLAVRNADGQLILRDTAQTPADDMDFFTDEHRHPYFHTNNLWIDLEQLKAALQQRGAVLGLPLIYNVKTVDPADSSSPKVIQLETAMGAAIEVFKGATAIAVPRSRFQPVKTTNELLLLRSDVFDLGADSRLNQTVPDVPRVDLDGRFYKLIDDFEARVTVAPSLKAATSFVVKGDWTFDRPVVADGDVTYADLGRPCVAGVDDPA
ncbi:MAG: UTP--glucose-1-phosphate uridylyltransferase [Micropruina glycogenica]